MNPNYIKLKEYSANRYLLFSILTFALGSKIFGGIALYNAIKYRDIILYSDINENATQAKIRQKRVACRVLLNVAMIVAVINVFFMFILILSIAMTMNDLLNSFA